MTRNMQLLKMSLSKIGEKGQGFCRFLLSLLSGHQSLAFVALLSVWHAGDILSNFV